MSDDEYDVVLTPLKGIEPGSHVMRIERVLISHLNKANVKHIAGGPYQGIIINKAAPEAYKDIKPDTERAFTAYVADASKNSKEFKREKRVLKFWFEDLAKVDYQVMEAITDTYFKELMNKEAFPKDYISFVKRVLNLVKQYSAILKLELIMRILQEGEDDLGMVMNRTLYRSKVTKTTVTTSRTVIGGIGQDDYIRLADGTLIDAHGTVIGNAPNSANIPKGGTFMWNGHTVHIQEDLRRLADGNIVNSHGNIVFNNSGSMSMPMGRTFTRNVDGETVHIQEDYMRLSDGIIVDSHGNIVSYGSDSMRRQMGDTINKSGKSVHIQEDYMRLADGMIIDSHGNVVGNTSDPAFIKQGDSYSFNAHRVHIQEDCRRLVDGSIVDSHGNLVTSDPDAVKLQKGGLYKWNGHTIHIQEDYRREADGNIVDSHGNIVIYAPDSMKTQNGGKFMWNGHNVHIQEDYRRLLDGSIVDSHGDVVIDSSGSMKMNKGEMRMRNGHGPHIQEDYMRLADGTIVDSHGSILYYGGDVTTLAQGGILGNITGKSMNGFGETSVTAASKRENFKTQRTITLKGWDVIWATKKQKLVNILEDAYPTVMTLDELVRESSMKRTDVEYLIENLTERGLVKDVDNNRYIRIPQGQKLVIRQGTTQRQSRLSADMDTSRDRSNLSVSMDEEKHHKSHEFKMVAHIPHLPAKQQPVVAIVTLLFCEKVAVDAMLDFKTTYIRIKKGEGEGQVYTVGKIGPHIVVSTKLSRITGKDAMVAAGNTVTRLLGTFGMIEHVILVGVGGGVIAEEQDKFTRLGDIVASRTETAKEPVYIHSSEFQEASNTFKTKSWIPKDRTLEKIMSHLKTKSTSQGSFNGEWEKYIKEGAEELTGGETRYSRPSAESDRLYKVVDNKDVELELLTSAKGTLREQHPNKPMLFLGKVGCGKMLSKDDNARQAFTKETNALCIDSGFQAVMDSIEGNRKDSFAVIRGISDYQDGTHRRDWQPYASLVAAAFMKAVLLQLSHDEDSDDDN